MSVERLIMKYGEIIKGDNYLIEFDKKSDKIYVSYNNKLITFNKNEVSYFLNFCIKNNIKLK